MDPLYSMQKDINSAFNSTTCGRENAQALKHCGELGHVKNRFWCKNSHTLRWVFFDLEVELTCDYALNRVKTSENHSVCDSSLVMEIWSNLTLKYEEFDHRFFHIISRSTLPFKELLTFINVFNIQLDFKKIFQLWYWVTIVIQIQQILHSLCFENATKHLTCNIKSVFK